MSDREKEEEEGEAKVVETDWANAASKMTVSVRKEPRDRTREHDGANVPRPEK